MNVDLRPAVESDLEAINAIYSGYVVDTSVSFDGGEMVHVSHGAAPHAPPRVVSEAWFHGPQTPAAPNGQLSRP